MRSLANTAIVGGKPKDARIGQHLQDVRLSVVGVEADFSTGLGPKRLGCSLPDRVMPGVRGQTRALEDDPTDAEQVKNAGKPEPVKSEARGASLTNDT